VEKGTWKKAVALLLAANLKLTVYLSTKKEKKKRCGGLVTLKRSPKIADLVEGIGRPTHVELHFSDNGNRTTRAGHQRKGR